MWSPGEAIVVSVSCGGHSTHGWRGTGEREAMGSVPVEDTLEWAKWFEKANRVVAQENVGGAFV